MQILGVPGSLRKKSYSTALLNSLSDIAGNGIEFHIAAPLDRLPYFNPDVEKETIPEEVRIWKKEIELADAVIFFTPEYVHNISGVLKNAIEWLVSSHEIVGKPVTVIAASPNHLGAIQAFTSLSHIMDVISGNLLKSASCNFSSINKKFDESGKLADPEIIKILKNSLDEIQKSIK